MVYLKYQKGENKSSPFGFTYTLIRNDYYSCLTIHRRFCIQQRSSHWHNEKEKRLNSVDWMKHVTVLGPKVSGADQSLCLWNYSSYEGLNLLLVPLVSHTSSSSRRLRVSVMNLMYWLVRVVSSLYLVRSSTYCKKKKDRRWSLKIRDQGCVQGEDSEDFLSGGSFTPAMLGCIGQHCPTERQTNLPYFL